MKWFRICSVVLASLGMSAIADAGMMQCGAGKSCGCGPSDQPACCQPKIMYKPVVVRPACPSVHGYQRQCVKPACYDGCCSTGSCGPRGRRASCCNTNCGPNNCGPANCGPANCGPTNCGPNNCGPNNCGPAKCGAVADPAGPNCAAPVAKCGPPADPSCAAPAAKCGPVSDPAGPNCAAPARNCGPANCGPTTHCGTPTNGCGPTTTNRCCPQVACGIAQWIYVSQTACYAKERRAALHRLGKCDCSCNPEIMCAFVYGLNDADERVRLQAATEIAAQLKRNRCCCSDKVAQALMCALGDCDKKVRKSAEKGLCLCGYEVADACSIPCAVASCGTNGTCGPASTHCGPAATHGATPVVPANPAGVETTPMNSEPADEASPMPAPPAAEPEAYFPARIREQQTGASRARSKLANLFGLR